MALTKFVLYEVVKPFLPDFAFQDSINQFEIVKWWDGPKVKTAPRSRSCLKLSFTLKYGNQSG